MSMNGVCDLELRQLIEGAFLPDRCEVRCGEGALSLYFPADALRPAMTVSDIQLGTLPDCRALKELVQRVRRERERQSTGQLSQRMAGR